MKWVIVSLFLVFCVWLFNFKEKSVNVLRSDVATVDKVSEVEKRVEFEELTIPYLRSREYVSELGERTIFQEKQKYTSYLTNYLSDGLKINGLLTIPKGDVPYGGWPAIVFVHGYIPPTQYKTTEKYVEYIDYLARNGFVVFKVDLRGHGKSEGEPGGAYYSSDYIVDVLNAYSAMQDFGYVNKDSVGLWGHSMAGNVLMRSAVTKKDIPVVVIWAGAVYSYADFGKYGISDNSYRPTSMSVNRQKRRQEIFDRYGQYNQESEFWKLVNPLNFLEGVDTRFYIHHATDDNVVNVGYSRDLVSELEEMGIGVKYHEYKTGGHNISGAVFGSAMESTVNNFREGFLLN